VRKLILLAALISSFALVAVTAQAQAQNPNCPAGTSDPDYCGPPPPPKAPGYWCNQANASKDHAPGEKGTEFSSCVHALNQLRQKRSVSATAACTRAKAPKRKHRGSKRTGFQKCVAAGNSLRRSQRA
jgi:hypothetical protein